MAAGPKRKPKKKTKSERRKAASRSLHSKLLEEMGGKGQLDDTLVLVDPPRAEKMSEVLLDYAEPLMDEIPVDDEAQSRKALSIAMLCWNAALATEEQREEMLVKFLELTKARTESEREEVLEMLRFMVQRKNELFPKIERFIVGFEVKTAKRRREVVVVSTLEKGHIRKLLPKVRKPWWRRILFWM